MRRRDVVIEEGLATEDPFSVRLQFPGAQAAPQVGEQLQFQKPDGGFRSFVVTHTVWREVQGGAEAVSEFDIYVLVSRTALEWTPL